MSSSANKYVSNLSYYVELTENFHLAFKSENKEGNNQYFTKKKKITNTAENNYFDLKNQKISQKIRIVYQYRQKPRMPVH